MYVPRDVDEEEQRPWWRYAAAVIIALSLLLATVMVAYGKGSAPVSDLKQLVKQWHGNYLMEKQRADALQQKLNSLLQCRVSGSDLESIKDWINRGEYALAADFAEGRLTHEATRCLPGPIGALWYHASMDKLYAMSSASPLDQSSVTTWQTIRQKAQGYQVQQDSPVEVFQTAYNNGAWRLSVAAFTVALRQQVVSIRDVRLLITAYSAMRNLGDRLVALGGSGRASGIKLLATARSIAHHASLPKFEADRDLQRLLGNKRAAKVQPDYSNPILSAVLQGQ